MKEKLIIPREQHNISRAEISNPALKVLYRLKKSGFDAYLVGGGIRDILIGLQPKDFDIVSNATPEQITNIFNNAIIIGRRFKLVHIRFGREIIEAATYRAANVETNLQTSEGMILRDNCYGTLEEDAIRRDFTINALYYNIADFSVVDYVGGMQDLKQKIIRIIGDPYVRYREDPVRMLRAIRFANKLGFEIDNLTKRPIPELSDLLLQISPARIFEEYLKLFFAGKSLVNFQQLEKFNLIQYLFPNYMSSEFQDNPYGKNLLQAALTSTDNRIQQNKTIAPYFLIAVILWPSLQTRANQYKKLNMIIIDNLIDELIDNHKKSMAIPRRFQQMLYDMLLMQFTLDNRKPRKAAKLFRAKRFRAAYDLLLLRTSAGEEATKELCNWWTDYISEKS